MILLKKKTTIKTIIWRLQFFGSVYFYIESCEPVSPFFFFSLFLFSSRKEKKELLIALSNVFQVNVSSLLKSQKSQRLTIPRDRVPDKINQ